ncbi:MAG: nitroreductase family protein, partial [Lachnospiraceae bacterium]|nr:nitroreductase family protein [Lachnospiraceae bacterium]
MKDTLEVMESRSSCRKYTDKPVPRDVIEKIVRAGTYAATGMGKQSPVILVVDNKELRDRLSKMNAAVMNADMDPFYGAPQVIVVLADKNVATYVYDGSLVMGNMMNA